MGFVALSVGVLSCPVRSATVLMMSDDARTEMPRTSIILFLDIGAYVYLLFGRKLLSLPRIC